MRPPGAPDQLEQRRRLAVQRLQAGQPMSAVARQMQASVSSVWRWWQTYQRAGPRGLRPTPTPGRPPRLSEGQLRTLERILARGPRRAGYPTASGPVRTCAASSATPRNYAPSRGLSTSP